MFYSGPCPTPVSRMSISIGTILALHHRQLFFWYSKQTTYLLVLTVRKLLSYKQDFNFKIFIIACNTHTNSFIELQGSFGTWMTLTLGRWVLNRNKNQLNCLSEMMV
ncbi:unnamed protein product [Chrysodeixis includens]|uniref:Uncharacterized protein n=1 Tax=Chrysodeixis includens TaxID=689277 RepID=A0A9N8KQK4_CHRIL|nr:unnamed protein product [Chrysodeixis includens]